MGPRYFLSMGGRNRVAILHAAECRYVGVRASGMRPRLKGLRQLRAGHWLGFHTEAHARLYAEAAKLPLRLCAACLEAPPRR